MKQIIKNIAPVLALTALAGFASAVNADIIALYEFGTVEAPGYSSTDTDSNSTAGNFAPAAGLGSTGNWNTTNNGIAIADGNPPPAFDQKPIAKTQATTFSDNAYWGFTVTPDAGNQISLINLTFDLTIKNSTRPISYYLATNVDGFDSPVQAPVIARTTSGLTTIDMNIPSLQNVSGPVEVRLYLFADLAGSSGSAWVFDNVTLNGTVAAIPEPATLAMLAVAGLMICSRRRSA